MSNDKTQKQMILWEISNGLILARHGHYHQYGGDSMPVLMLKDECPCGEPKVIAQQTTHINNEDGGLDHFVLSPYRFLGTPGYFWLFRDVGVSHWNDDSKGCSGVEYGHGRISDTGELLGLADIFYTRYNYLGYMQIQEGFYDCTTDYVIMPCGRYSLDHFSDNWFREGWNKPVKR